MATKEIDLVSDSGVKALKEAIDNQSAALIGAMTDTYDETSTLQEVKDMRTIDGVAADSAGKRMRNKFKEVDTAIGTKANTVDLNLQKTRIDNIIANAGDTGDNAELVDIRIGADGKTYSTAGEAIREQVSQLGETLDDKQDKYINKGGIETNYYPTNESLTPIKTYDFCCFNNIPVVEDGVLKSIKFNGLTSGGIIHVLLFEFNGSELAKVYESGNINVIDDYANIFEYNIQVKKGQVINVVPSGGTLGAKFKVQLDTSYDDIVYYNYGSTLTGVKGMTTRIYEVITDNGEDITVIDKINENTENIKNNKQTIVDNIMLSTEELNSYPYPYKYVECEKTLGTENFSFFDILNPITKNGYLKFLYLDNIICETDKAIILIAEITDEANRKINIKEVYNNITISSLKNDLTEYNIKVSQGDYVVFSTNNKPSGGVQAINWINVNYSLINGNGQVCYISGINAGENTYNILSGAKGFGYNFTIRTDNYGEDISIKEKVIELDEERKEQKNDINCLNNQMEESRLSNNFYATKNILHIGTSISDGKTVRDNVKLCTWFEQAMKIINCQNGLNMAESGKSARYFAQNYDTLIKPFIENADIFTIEHYINDYRYIGEQSDMVPDSEGNYNLETYYGAMAYIITRARNQNMFAKIGLMSHWSDTNIAEPIVNVANKFNLPVLDVGTMLGGNSQQVIDTTMLIYGQEFSGSKTINAWYSTYPLCPGGDGLHPFNEYAQKKYALMYANWVRSW